MQARAQLRVYNQLKPADADGQRELAQISLKLNEKEGAPVATGLADALDAKADLD